RLTYCNLSVCWLPPTSVQIPAFTLHSLAAQSSPPPVPITKPVHMSAPQGTPSNTTSVQSAPSAPPTSLTGSLYGFIASGTSATAAPPPQPSPLNSSLTGLQQITPAQDGGAGGN
ncbi:hypothetical protein FRC12_021440, partial [Ceratobasidium sp. 428]